MVRISISIWSLSGLSLTLNMFTSFVFSQNVICLPAWYVEIRAQNKLALITAHKLGKYNLSMDKCYKDVLLNTERHKLTDKLYRNSVLEIKLSTNTPPTVYTITSADMCIHTCVRTYVATLKTGQNAQHHRLECE